MIQAETTVAEYEKPHERPVVCVQFRPVLLRSQDRTATPCPGGLRGLDHGDPGRSIGPRAGRRWSDRTRNSGW